MHLASPPEPDALADIPSCSGSIPTTADGPSRTKYTSRTWVSSVFQLVYLRSVAPENKNDPCSNTTSILCSVNSTPIFALGADHGYQCIALARSHAGGRFIHEQRRGYRPDSLPAQPLYIPMGKIRKVGRPTLHALLIAPSPAPAHMIGTRKKALVAGSRSAPFARRSAVREEKVAAIWKLRPTPRRARKVSRAITHRSVPSRRWLTLPVNHIGKSWLPGAVRPISANSSPACTSKSCCSPPDCHQSGESDPNL